MTNTKSDRPPPPALPLEVTTLVLREGGAYLLLACEHCRRAAYFVNVRDGAVRLLWARAELDMDTRDLVDRMARARMAVTIPAAHCMSESCPAQPSPSE